MKNVVKIKKGKFVNQPHHTLNQSPQINSPSTPPHIPPNHPSNPKSLLHSPISTGLNPSFLLKSICFPICSNRDSRPWGPAGKVSGQKGQRVAGGVGLGEGWWEWRVREVREVWEGVEVLVLVFLEGLFFGEGGVVVSCGVMLSGCILRTCCMKRSLRLKSLWAALGVFRTLLLLLSFLWLLLVLLSGLHKSHRQNPRRKCWVVA